MRALGTPRAVRATGRTELHRSTPCWAHSSARGRKVSWVLSAAPGGTESQRSGVKAKGVREGKQLPSLQEVLPHNVEAASSSTPVQQTTGAWDSLPARYKVVVGCAASFVICNMVSCMGAHTAGCALKPSVASDGIWPMMLPGLLHDADGVAAAACLLAGQGVCLLGCD